MTMPFYIDPEQLTKDRADFSRRGVSRGLPVIAASSAEGIVIIALNSSTSLMKIGEVHDRIAFAGAGKFHEYEALRLAAVRWADTRAYQYSRRDVSASSLANALAHAIGEAFVSAPKPLEIALLLPEVGEHVGDDRIFSLSFDGSLSDHGTFAAIGGVPEGLASRALGADLDKRGADEVIDFCIDELSHTHAHAGTHAEIGVLRRGVALRAFERHTPRDMGGKERIKL
ncbi:proteasome subunit alpha [Dermabacter sp. HSID17554]|uniref:proteasome subunit alpha n=1 Tax=Dermabacter sp. HSID17554 TaxID=2419511 RepID=UPI000F864AE8|nr:proteasome subunit alpha [Dermabacter sp. HSID17554]RUP87178.1 proteasome subunit alpha [Dermabacter sp. HSID17554]